MRNERATKRRPTPTAAELRRRVRSTQRLLARLDSDHASARADLAATVVTLHDEHGMTYRQLGELLGVSHVAVLKLVSHR